MPTHIEISRNLITKQDLALGAGQVTQQRNGTDYTLDKINAKQIPLEDGTSSIQEELEQRQQDFEHLWDKIHGLNAGNLPYIADEPVMTKEKIEEIESEVTNAKTRLDDLGANNIPWESGSPNPTIIQKVIGDQIPITEGSQDSIKKYVDDNSGLPPDDYSSEDLPYETGEQLSTHDKVNNLETQATDAHNLAQVANTNANTAITRLDGLNAETIPWTPDSQMPTIHQAARGDFLPITTGSQQTIMGYIDTHERLLPENYSAEDLPWAPGETNTNAKVQELLAPKLAGSVNSALGIDPAAEVGLSVFNTVFGADWFTKAGLYACWVHPQDDAAAFQANPSEVGFFVTVYVLHTANNYFLNFYSYGLDPPTGFAHSIGPLSLPDLNAYRFYPLNDLVLKPLAQESRDFTVNKDRVILTYGKAVHLSYFDSVLKPNWYITPGFYNITLPFGGYTYITLIIHVSPTVNSVISVNFQIFVSGDTPNIYYYTIVATKNDLISLTITFDNTDMLSASYLRTGDNTGAHIPFNDDPDSDTIAVKHIDDFTYLSALLAYDDSFNYDLGQITNVYIQISSGSSWVRIISKSRNNFGNGIHIYLGEGLDHWKILGHLNILYSTNGINFGEFFIADPYGVGQQATTIDFSVAPWNTIIDEDIIRNMINHDQVDFVELKFDLSYRAEVQPGFQRTIPMKIKMPLLKTDIPLSEIQNMSIMPAQFSLYTTSGYTSGSGIEGIAHTIIASQGKLYWHWVLTNDRQNRMKYIFNIKLYSIDFVGV